MFGEYKNIVCYLECSVIEWSGDNAAIEQLNWACYRDIFWGSEV